METNRTLDAQLENASTPTSRDMKLNFVKLTEEGALSREEALLTTLACATSLHNPTIAAWATVRLEKLDFTKDQLAEARESASVMGMLNVYYRFRHMVQQNDAAQEKYRVTGLRMNTLARPTLGKERFEMLAFALSVLNGCGSCICSHEETLLKAGVTPDKIHDLARLAAVIKGVDALGW